MYCKTIINVIMLSFQTFGHDCSLMFDYPTHCYYLVKKAPEDHLEHKKLHIKFSFIHFLINGKE